MPVVSRVLAKTADRGYGKPHQDLRAWFEPLVRAGGYPCCRCGDVIPAGGPWDLGHVDGDKSRYTGPEHRACNRATSGRSWGSEPVEELPERVGLDVSDERWRVPWLKGLRRVPKDATWPRLMTVPHPAAVGSLGPGFCRWADQRIGGRLRWWQRLAATRMLEVDDSGRLVWDAVLLSMARQLGKSWLLRELCLWRIEQGDRFGEPQDVLHTGKDLAVCIEVQRSARIWARTQDVYQVREASGREAIEYLPGPGGRWLLKSKGAPYGYTISHAVVDEAWNVDANHIEEGVAPTMVERVSPQLLLVSTAHRLATSLMLVRRKAALEQLETGEGDLLVEWSAPRGASIDDLGAWRLASPHWTPGRQKLIQRRLDAMYAGETQDATEVDPGASFRAQWLNQWPKGLTVLDGEELLPAGLWRELAEPGVRSEGPVWVAVESDYGHGAAVAVAAPLEDGRLEIDGRSYPDWDTALDRVRMLAALRPVRQVQVGASMLVKTPPTVSPVPVPAGNKETRPGLAVFRDLAVNRQLVHDVTPQLDEAVQVCRVKQGTVGLVLASRPRHLISALVWAVQAAWRPVPVAAIY